MNKYLVRFNLGSEAMIKCEMEEESKEKLAAKLTSETNIEIKDGDQLSIVFMSQVKYMVIKDA